MEGIETLHELITCLRHLGISRCPDMEGIETLMRHVWGDYPQVSVGAPTWRGLKRVVRPNPQRIECISRCPDMEGIETPRFRITIGFNICQ